MTGSVPRSGATRTVNDTLRQRLRLALPLLLLTGLVFSAIGLIVNAKARGYDFFTYYFTLVLTPMTFLSGVYFPLTALPQPL